MNKKYLLRGIGIGIIIGVSIMFAAWKTGGSSSEGEPAVSTEAVTQAPTEEITEATTEAATEKKTEAATEVTTEATTEATTEKKTEATTEATTEKKTEATTEKATEEKTTEAATEKATEEKTEEATTEEKKESKDGNVTVEVTSGMGSEDVSAALQENGIIKDADEFNAFLISNGYDAQLRVGSFSLKSGDSFENLAKVLTTEGE